MMQRMDMAALAQHFDWRLSGDAASFDRVCSDSRQLRPGDFFVALRGERFDGHDFIPSVAAKGAAGALVEHQVRSDLPQLVCPDSLRGLAQMAGLNRSRFEGTVVALTGSAGKTSTRQMIAGILALAGPTLVTRGNFNNEIGAPLMLLELAPVHRYAVFELGAAKRGDIRYLVDIVRPDVALLTNAREAHLETFGDLDTVAATKGEIYSTLQSDQVAVINADEPYYSLWRDLAAAARQVSFGLEAAGADVRAADLELRADGSRFRLLAEGLDVVVDLPVAGRHMVANALAAAACARALGLSQELIAAGLAGFEPVAGRSQRVDASFGGTLFDDSYNANPASVRAAIDVLATQPGNTVLVLGDMLELGAGASAAHREVGVYACRRGIGRLWATGPLSQAAVDGFGPGARWFGTRQELLEHARGELGAADVVLVKGSRSSAMDEVVAGLRAAVVE